MKQSTWELLALVLAVVVVAAVVVAVAAAVAAVAAVAAAVAAVAAVVAAALDYNPKLSCCISITIIAICIVTLTQTLPIALNPPQTIEVICQVTQTFSPTIIIHNSMTQTISQAPSIVNSTTIEIASKVSCP